MTDMEPEDDKIKCVFTFKSKTLSGEPSRVQVTEYESGTVVIDKIIATKEDLTEIGYVVVRKFSNYGVYITSIAFFKSTLLTIADGLMMSEEYKMILRHEAE